MSKKLDSILNTMPPATVGSAIMRTPVQEQRDKERVGERDQSKKKGQSVEPDTALVLQAVKNEQPAITLPAKQIDEKMDRIVAMIPYSLKKEIKQYLVDHPGDTEKTVLLRSLRVFGFNVPERHLEDFRGKKSIK